MSDAAAMDYLPIFLRLEQRPVAVVGGGAIALRKVSTLRAAGAHITVIAPHLDPQLAAEVARGELRHVAAPFTAAHLGNAVVVIAATDDADVNRAISQAAQERGLPVNVVDDAELSTFIFPAIIDRSPILVAVSWRVVLRFSLVAYARRSRRSCRHALVRWRASWGSGAAH